MTAYTVYLTTSAFTSVQVEAGSADEAIDLAYDADMPRICAQCAGWGDDSRNLELGDEWKVTEVCDTSGTVLIDVKPEG